MQYMAEINFIYSFYFFTVATRNFKLHVWLAVYFYWTALTYRIALIQPFTLGMGIQSMNKIFHVLFFVNCILFIQVSTAFLILLFNLLSVPDKLQVLCQLLRNRNKIHSLRPSKHELATV